MQSVHDEGIRGCTTENLQMLRRFIQKRVSNQDDAEDLLQCTLLEALRCEHSFRNQCKRQTWLCGIALNLVRNHYRKLSRTPKMEHFAPGDAMELTFEYDLSQHVEAQRQLRRIADVFAGLPGQMREVVEVSFEFEGRYQDTAVALGVPIGTVRSRLARARERLRKQLA